MVSIVLRLHDTCSTTTICCSGSVNGTNLRSCPILKNIWICLWLIFRSFEAGTREKGESRHFLHLIMFIVDSNVILPHIEATTEDLIQVLWKLSQRWPVKKCGWMYGTWRMHKSALQDLRYKDLIWFNLLVHLEVKKSLFGEDTDSEEDEKKFEEDEKKEEKTDTEEDELPPAPVHTGQMWIAILLESICTFGWFTETGICNLQQYLGFWITMDHHGSPGAGVASIQHALTNVTSDGRPFMEEDQAVITGSLKHRDAHGMSMPGLRRRGRVFSGLMSWLDAILWLHTMVIHRPCLWELDRIFSFSSQDDTAMIESKRRFDHLTKLVDFTIVSRIFSM